MSVSKVDLDRLYVLGGLGATCFMPSACPIAGVYPSSPFFVFSLS